VIPLIEELFKPLAMWLLAGDRLTPAQGFYAGMLSGACFALWENLTAISASGDGTGTAIVIARVGTGLLHIVNAGLVSWGMTSFWQSRRYLGRMIGMYILAVTLHGLWNASGVLTGVAPVLQIPVEAAPLTQAVETGGIVVLVLLVFALLGVLLFANARLRSRPAVAEVLADQAASPVSTIPYTRASSDSLASDRGEKGTKPDGPEG
jgi:RsiW-degrading membrane proteinase PrsW (M82 family)